MSTPPTITQTTRRDFASLQEVGTILSPVITPVVEYVKNERPLNLVMIVMCMVSLYYLSLDDSVDPGAFNTSSDGPLRNGLPALPSRRPRPSHSPSNRPLEPCACGKEDNAHFSTTFIMDSDVIDPISQGIEDMSTNGLPGSSWAGVFAFTNVVGVSSRGPEYPPGRAITQAWGVSDQYPVSKRGTGGNELNLNTRKTLEPLMADKVPGQKCHLEPPPAYLWVDGGREGDAGEWFGESASMIGHRWEILKKTKPGVKLLLTAPTPASPPPYKKAVLQLLGIPDSQVEFITGKGDFPCAKGNRVYFPPLSYAEAGGWTRGWLHYDHKRVMLETWRAAAGLPKECPTSAPPATPANTVYIKLSAADKAARAVGGDGAFDTAMAEYISGKGGKVLAFPEGEGLKEGGKEAAEFVAAVGSARVVVAHASTSAWILAGLARGATVIVAEVVGSEVAVIKRPGHVVEKELCAVYNWVVELSSDHGKAVTRAKELVEDALAEKDKESIPKCVPKAL